MVFGVVCCDWEFLWSMCRNKCLKCREIMRFYRFLRFGCVEFGEEDK